MSTSDTQSSTHGGYRPAPAVRRPRGAAGDLDHVFRTWHPRTRPADLQPAPELRWRGLEILRVTGGGTDDSEGTVEFRARYAGPAGAGVLHETSRFERRAGRWVYVDGDVD